MLELCCEQFLLHDVGSEKPTRKQFQVESMLLRVPMETKAASQTVVYPTASIH